MKLKNIFKKEILLASSANIQILETKQLSQVIGGGDGTAIDNTSSTKVPPSIRGVVIDK